MGAISVPPHWEALLWGYVKRAFYPGTRREPFAGREVATEGDYRFFAPGVRKLNELFTRDRAYLPKNYLNQKELRSGYILYFLPVNALKIAALLGQMRLYLPNPPPFTILDIGSGSGTAVLGVFLWLERHLAGLSAPLQLRWILVDQNRQALRDACQIYHQAFEELRRRFPHVEINSRVETIVTDLEQPFTNRLRLEANLILAVNVIGELAHRKRLSIIERLVRGSLKAGGRLLVVEPALQRTTRELMQLHDLLLARRTTSVVAPCLHQAACPMLAANKRDWCHTTIEWERPPWIERFDRLVGIRKDYLKCSYLALGRPGEAPTYPNSSWRVVSGQLSSRGKSELLLCGPGGLPNLLRVTRLDRDRSETNCLFDELRRGDLVQMEKTDRIVRTTPLSKIGHPMG